MKRPLKYLIVADPVERIQPRFDTSLRLAAELIRRGIEVDYCDLRQTDASLAAEDYLNAIPAMRIVASTPEQTPFLELGPERRASVEEYAVILQRKDPPVDDFFAEHNRLWSQAPKHILQINDPDQTWRHSEHELPQRYPQYSIPTYTVNTADEFVRKVRELEPESVAKPFNECSGAGVEFFKRDASDLELRGYWAANGPRLVVQPYIDEITKSGDLRILTLNGRILGHVMRVARPGSRLANLHQGASWRAWEPSARQREAALHIGADLAKIGLYLLGLDFIGDQISEINITSPSAMVQINDVMGKRTEVELIDGIEELRRQRQADRPSTQTKKL